MRISPNPGTWCTSHGSTGVELPATSANPAMPSRASMIGAPPSRRGRTSEHAASSAIAAPRYISKNPAAWANAPRATPRQSNEFASANASPLAQRSREPSATRLCAGTAVTATTSPATTAATAAAPANARHGGREAISTRHVPYGAISSDA